ncbi:MAG TPA: sigma-70 family RNA polymerase sigma factor [Bryobacteraceae bacterium]|nr:sigma-70 family RNA polymerase sigma factor [Bryobacteraceae bacterium]
MTEQDAASHWAIRGADSAAPSDQEQLVIALFDESRTALLRYLFSLGLPLQDAEEVIQEVFLALFEHLKKRKPARNLRGWIFRVAHNLGLKRRLESRREVSSHELDHLVSVRPDPAANPEEQLAANQQHQRLQAVLQGMPERDRWCLALRAEGLRYREIAETLDLSLGSVADSLARSLARLSRAGAD